MDACGWGRESASCGRPHIKLGSTDVFSCKEVDVFWTTISSFDGIKSGNISSVILGNINY